MGGRGPSIVRLKQFCRRDLPVERWLNGGGVTGVVASRCDDAGKLRWRISIADVERNGPFSVLEGVERTAVLLRGPGLALHGPRSALSFDRVGAMASFDGEELLQASLGPEPARLWNVMSARGAVRSHVEVAGGRHGSAAPASVGALLVLEGSMAVSREGHDTFVLKCDEGFVLDGADVPVRWQSSEATSRWLLTTIFER